VIRFATACYSFPLVTLEQAARIAATLGFEYLDVGAWEIPVNLSREEIVQSPRAVADRLKRVSDREGIGFSDFFPTFGEGRTGSPLNTRDPQEREANDHAFGAFVELCRTAAIPGMTLLPGLTWPDIPHRQSLELSRDALRRYASIAGDAGLRLGIEAHLESVVEDPTLARQLLEQVPGLTLTMDYAHFVAGGYPIEDAHALLPYTAHFQARQAAPGKLQAAGDAGTIDFVDIMHRLASRGYDGFVAVEYVWQEWRDNNRVDVVSETVMLRDLLEHARAPSRVS
jgi:sugar phosphate isomerase/epimerase